jgi:hypothetical protein
MNFRKMVERQIDSLFRTMKGLVQDAVYRGVVSYAHNANHRAVVQTDDVPIKCIVTTFQKHEIDFAGGRIGIADKKILVPLKGIAAPFQLNGKIIIDNVEYGIENVETDPTASLAIIQARS